MNFHLDQRYRAADALQGREERLQALLENLDELAASGIAGTDTPYPFFAPTARWLTARCPQSLSIDWDEFTESGELDELLPMLALYTEHPAVDECAVVGVETADGLTKPWAFVVAKENPPDLEQKLIDGGRRRRSVGVLGCAG